MFLEKLNLKCFEGRYKSMFSKYNYLKEINLSKLLNDTIDIKLIFTNI